jgi:3-hydroxyacyl-CoA dehydrogenase
MLNEAFLCVEEDIANLNDIDMACIAGLGMQVNVNGRLERMGPLAYSDQVGLDVVLEALQDLQARYGRRFKPAEILVEKVEAGELGQKSMRGFLEYAV